MENQTYEANLIEYIRTKNYNSFSKEPQMTNIIFTNMIKNYLEEILKDKITNIEDITNKAKTIGTNIVEFITGNYDIGIENRTFEEIDEISETYANITENSDEKEIKNIIDNGQERELAETLVDGSIASGIMPIDFSKEDMEKANSNFNKLGKNFKDFFKNSIHNILHINEQIANGIAHISGLDNEESKELNTNIYGKLVGGMAYDLISGTLMNKRIYTGVLNSKSMNETIEKEGILHFSSPATCEKIIKSGEIKASNILTSDMTTKKSFFFGGVPTPEDLLINIPLYNVMTAVRIKPTEEDLKKLKYRPLNDRAVVYDGNYHFKPEQAKIVYLGLMYDKEKRALAFKELQEEEVEKYEPSEELKKVYDCDKKPSLNDNIKINAYGLYAEYKHHQKFLKMEKMMREKGLTFRDFTEEELVKLSDIENAYIDTIDKSVERRNVLSRIKNLITKNKTNEKIINNEGERNV